MEKTKSNCLDYNKTQDLTALSHDQLLAIRQAILQSFRAEFDANNSTRPRTSPQTMRKSTMNSLSRSKSSMSLPNATFTTSTHASGVEFHDDNSVVYIPNPTDNPNDDDDVDSNTIVTLSDISSDEDDQDVTIVAVTALPIVETPSGRKRPPAAAPSCGAKRCKSFSGSVIVLDDDVECSTPNVKIQDGGRQRRIDLSPITTGTETPKKSACVAATSTSELQVATQVVDKQQAQVDKEKVDGPDGDGNNNCQCQLHPDILRQFAEATENIKKLFAVVGILKNCVNVPKALDLDVGHSVLQLLQNELQDGATSTALVPATARVDLTEKREVEVLQPSRVFTNAKHFLNNIHLEGSLSFTGLRPIVIDGSNVAMSHGHNRQFSVRGLKICIDFFLNRRHMVYAFVPAFRLKVNQSSDQALLQKLDRQGHIVWTPSYEVNGRKFCSYDDRIFLQVAAKMGAVVVSRDNFRDLVAEDRNFAFVVEHRLLMPTWVGNMIIFPQDPQGRYGPNLNRFLRF